MTVRPIDLDDLRSFRHRGSADEPPVLVVDLDRSPTRADEPDARLPFVVVGIASGDRPERHTPAGAVDVVVTSGAPALDAIITTVEANPLAATALVLVLRGNAHRSIDDGLLVESATYSALQGGPEFASWRAARPRRARSREGPPIALERHGDRLDITLTRPQVRNALNTAMRDALVDAFDLAALDATITEIRLRGEGPSFCAGGDLDEFGSFPDPATAHLVRVRQSVGRAIATVSERVTAHLHGACFGSGIELPAFASTVVATPDTVIALPEVALGLIPGAGGTVSIPGRIGRHRTARLALTGEHLDATTALEWGLVDAIDSDGTGAPQA
jgi:enoyl-CoA hydratase/carnithine racemase